MSATEQLSVVDRAWLLMDRPANPMMIVGLIVFATPVERAVLRDLITRRFLIHRRFLCVPVSHSTGGSWVEAGEFDIDDQVLCHALPAPAGQRELESLVGELASTPFSSGRPLWSFHLIEHYGQGSALIVRIHHSYADGVALLQVLLSLADRELQAGGARARRSKHSAIRAAGADISSGWPSGPELTEQAIHLALHPLEASTLLRKTLGLAGELARVGLLSADPQTRLKRPLSGIRHVAWAEPLSFPEIRTLSHVLGCTVNDILMSTLAGALGRYLEARGDFVSGMTIRAAVPVNLRTEEMPSTLGNYFGLVFVELPIGIRHPLERLYTVRTAMQNLKGSQQALVTLGLLALIGSLPAAAEEPMIALFSAKASLVASNLRGPTTPLRIAGARVSQVLFWVPQAGDIGIGVSMLSYDGQVQFGIMADRHLIPKPAEMIREIAIEFERLVLLLLLGGAASMPA